jgi:hypothetical protein
MAGVFLSLRRVLPDRYPLALDVEGHIADEQRLGERRCSAGRGATEEVDDETRPDASQSPIS